MGDVLRHAARIIEERGWNQGGYSDRHEANTGAVCAFGAINLARHGRHDEADIDTAAKACVYLWNHNLIGVTDGGLTAWNDLPGRTAAEVIAALRAAADEADR